MKDLLRKFLAGGFLITLVGIASGQAVPKRAVQAASPDAVTREQADEIVNELRQIRQLLEKQEAQLTRALAQQRPTPSPATPQRVQMSVGTDMYTIGRADAPVTLVEFADYQCPYCKKFHSEVYSNLKANYIDTGKVRFVSRDLPLEFHPFALKAAEATRCAGDQGKYWEYRDVLYSSSGAPSDDVIKNAAETLSLDMHAFNLCLATDKYRSVIQRDSAEAAELQVTGTPTFVLARTEKDKLVGVRLVGIQPYASLRSAIDELLRNSPSAKDKQADKQGVQ